MMRCSRLNTLVVGLALGSAAIAQDETPPRDQSKNGAPITAEWKMDSVELKKGADYRGLVLSSSEHELDFVQIVRPKGRPMYLVRLSLDPKSVKRIERVDDESRKELQDRIQPLLQFKSHALIEAGRMEDVNLTRADGEADETWKYNGPWFQLESTTDERQTRRCVVRIEQIVRAYQRVMPPRARPQKRLTVKLFGSMDEYQNELRDLQLEIENPAFYSARGNTIVAGSELTAFARRLSHILGQNEKIRKDYEAIDREMPAQLASLSTKLKSNGFTRDEIKLEMKARKAAWRKQYDGIMRKLDATNRRNEAKFSEVTKQMFTRLYHEMFHAYLENYVYPQELFSVPRWLNEGLAQIFETAQVDEDTLRIDLPDPGKMARLQQDLRGRKPLSIAGVIQAEDASFLATHSSGSSERHYLYSWGLAYYFTFHDDLLYRNTLDEFVIDDKESRTQIQRFSKLTRIPLNQFEERWRTTILEATTASR